MSEIAQQSLQSNGWTDRADELFQQHRQEIYRNTDQLFARLMLFQWVAAIMIAMIISPRTWVGQSSYIHIHIWAAIFMGGAISVFPIWMTRAWPGAALTRHIIAVAQMLMSVSHRFDRRPHRNPFSCLWIACHPILLPRLACLNPGDNCRLPGSLPPRNLLALLGVWRSQRQSVAISRARGLGHLRRRLPGDLVSAQCT